MEIEFRSVLPAEYSEENDEIKVEGYAAVFDEVTLVGGFFNEVFKRGAFSKTISRDDITFLINHDGLPLARTKSKTLILKEDERGLKIQTSLSPDDPDVQKIIPKMKRGDLDKMSVAFWAEVQEWDETSDVALRTITEAGLKDVSIVTVPQYQGTEIALRSLNDHRQANKSHNFNATQRRLRMKNNLASRIF